MEDERFQANARALRVGSMQVRRLDAGEWIDVTEEEIQALSWLQEHTAELIEFLQLSIRSSGRS